MQISHLVQTIQPFHWRKLCIMARGLILINDGFVFTSQDVMMDWSGVDCLWIIVMFLSAVWILILTAPIHCRGSIGEQVIQICSDEEINSSTS